MTCKDCIHYEVCGTLTNPCYPDEANKSEILCNNFKNKADFVEMETLTKFLEQIKTEAIKEFWERLKLKKAAVDSWVVYVESGDNLVKEMIGGDTDE